jgi:PAS domain S-box-containing protein
VATAATDRLESVLRGAGVSELLSLADVMRDLVAITDVERRILYLNRAGAEMIGLADASAIVGREIGAITTKRGAERLDAKQPVVLESGFWRGDCELLHTSGAVIPVEADCFAVRDPQSGAPLGFISLQRDITVRREQEAALARWALVAENSHDAMLTIDASGEVTSWNPAAERVFGWSAEEALAGGIELIDPAYDEPGRSEPIRQAFRGEEPPPFEATCRRKDGSEFVAAITVTLLPAPDGDYPEIAVLARDVTEERRAEEEARAGQVQLHEMAQNMREGLWLRDIERAELLFVSPGYDEIFGTTRGELVDDPRAWIEHVHEDDRERAWAFAADETGTDPIELRIVRHGEVRWILVRPFVVPDTDGNPYRRGGVVEDITANKREALRLSELAELRRRLVTQTLDAEDRERSRLSVALHDEVLQLLLAAGQDLDEALERAPVPAVAHARATLHTAVKELRAAVRDLHPLVLDHLGAAAAIRQLGSDFARRGDFRFNAEIRGDVPSAVGRLVVTLARELIANAARHSQAARVDCVIDAGPDRVVVSVSDDGCGFAPGRLQDAVTAGHIGLASARERVEAAGGSMTVSSSPGIGTSVSIELPVQS